MILDKDGNQIRRGTDWGAASSLTKSHIAKMMRDHLEKESYFLKFISRIVDRNGNPFEPNIKTGDSVSIGIRSPLSDD